MKITLNPDIGLVDMIRSKLDENKILYDKRYCPCVLPNNHNEDTVCMCKEFREQNVNGYCHCQLYYKEMD